MLKEYLLERAPGVGAILTEDMAEALLGFNAMLMEANSRMNLTRVSPDEREQADRNYLDSLAVGRFVPAGTRTMADVGTGAGFPGVPLAVLRPEIAVTLMDSLGKRVDFLRDAAARLALNAQAVQIRAEDAGRMPEYREQFDVTVSRAVAALNVLCELCLPITRVGGRLLALKGPGLDEEISGAERALAELGGRLLSVEKIAIPGRDWDHRVAVIEKIAPTPEKYPRRAGVPEKRPIM